MRLRNLFATKKRKAVATAAAIFCLALATLVVAQAIYVERAHSTFENYYAFRGCQQLLTKTDNDATCRLTSSQTIKMVRYQGKWYLDSDLPVCWLGKSLCL